MSHSRSHDEFKGQWMSEQLELKKQLILEDSFNWSLEEKQGKERLRLIGGVDISFVNDVNSNQACASLVVLSFPELKVVYEDYQHVELTLPYIPGFLAFREVGFIVDLVKKLQKNNPELVPQLIMCDGNGILHTRGFGIASHLGVLVDIPTLGVAKTFFSVDGMTERGTKEISDRTLLKGGDYFLLQGKSGTIWGAAIRCLDSAKNPVFISQGHRVSLETCIQVVQKTSLFRIPEPIRQADLRSRQVVKDY